MRVNFKAIVASVLLGLGLNLSAYALAPGEIAPNFKLPGIDGKEYELSNFKGKTVVLEWYNRGCPFVRKHYDSKNMQNLQKKYVAQDVVWLTVVSSAEGKQGHADQKSGKEDYDREQMSASAFLLDPEGKVGRLYDAVTTPHMYIIDPQGTLVYEGAIDSTPSADQSDIAKSTNYVDQALSEVLANKKVSVAKTKPYGCSVKYN